MNVRNNFIILALKVTTNKFKLLDPCINKRQTQDSIWMVKIED